MEYTDREVEFRGKIDQTRLEPKPCTSLLGSPTLGNDASTGPGSKNDSRGMVLSASCMISWDGAN